MGRGITTTKISKDYILSKVDQTTIFSVYFDIPIKVINQCLDTGELICSPIRDDIHPTCGFRYDNKGKLKFKDFAGYFWGDCFDAVALILSIVEKRQINISKKEDFLKVLRHITFTFKDIFYGDKKDPNLVESIHESIELIKKQKPIIELVIRNWNEYDREYWSKMNIDFQVLNINFVYPIDQYYIDRKINPNPKYYYDKDDPCYAYMLGRDKKGIYNIKLYFPKRNHNQTRFICNCNHLEGIYNLDRNDYDFIVLTKSTKDRVCIVSNLMRLHSLYGDLNIGKIGVINIPHETYRLRNNEYNWLKSKLADGGKIVSLMDNDRTGMCEANWLRNTYNIIPLLIPPNYNSKDFSELVMNNSFDKVKDLIIQTLNNINEYENYINIRNSKKSNSQPF